MSILCFLGLFWQGIFPFVGAFNLRHTASGTETISVYIRLKPLVGGPQFLPIHAEIWTVSPEISDQPNRLLSGMRYDFLPVEPTASGTIQRLLLLKAVPGRIRRRTLENATQRLNRKEKGGVPHITFFLKLGTSTLSRDLTSVVGFCDRYESERGALHLIRNNCYSFAFAFIQHLELKSINLSLVQFVQ